MRKFSTALLFGGIASLLASFPALAEITLIANPGKNPAAVTKMLRRRPEILRLENVFDESERQALRRLGEGEMAGALKLTLRDRKDAESLEYWARSKSLTVRFEDNPAALALDAGSAATIHEDPLEKLQWGLHNRGIPQRLDVDDLTTAFIPGKTGEDIGLASAPAESWVSTQKIIVAVLDTGVDLGHPDLQGQLMRKPSECEALDQYKACLKQGTADSCAELAKVDTDGNGYPLDCVGWNITAGRNATTGIYGGPDVTDDAGHGTHVSGIIAAALNGIGIRGVSQAVQILPVKVIKSAPNSPIRPQEASSPNDTTAPLPAPVERDLKWSTGFGDVIARGMLYAIRSHAQIINLSLAWPAGVDSLLMRRMVALAHSRGILIVAAAGNDSADSRVFPCLYPGVICVASHGPDGALSHFSNYGSFVDIAAPGIDILSTWPLGKRTVNYTANDGFEIKNGTSMASPFIAGMLARLLGAGFSPEEAFARLLSGARPQSISASVGAPMMSGANAKYTRSGNADLGGAFRAIPQPLILEEDKSIVKLTWDWKATELSLSVRLHNFWSGANQVRIHAALSTPSNLSAGAHLAVSDWTMNGWTSGETRELVSHLIIDTSQVEGRLLLELTIEADQQAPRLIRIPMEIAVPITAATIAADGARVHWLDIQGGEISPDAELRSVTAFDGHPGQDYVAIEEGPQNRLTLLREVAGSHYEASSPVTIESPSGSLMLIQRLDADQDGKSDYVFIYRLPPPEGKDTPQFRFQYYDDSLKPLTSISANGAVDYDNQTSVITERFQWLRITSKGRDFLVPAWIGLGTTPLLEKPSFDPWNPHPSDPPKMRLYFLAPEGVHTVKAPKDSYFLQVFSPAAQERPAGSLSVLIGKGDDYLLQYSLATLDGGVLSNQTALQLDRFRMLAGIENVVGITSLSANTPVIGTAFSDAGARGMQRTTAILSDASGLQTGTLDFSQAPFSRLDSVMQISGLFLGAARKGAFAQSHYDLMYNDLTTGQVARTSLDRFSFLPAFIFARGFFPVVAEDPRKATGDRLPGILIPASLGVADGSEVVVPRYDAHGSLEGLSRPAQYRLIGSAGCQDLGNPVAGRAGELTQLAFFCGNHFLRIPLTN